ncbi:MAG TPA: histidine--tRNA ligase [Bacteroidales bacterium]|nr:histidine--tRNA ligase [Bacteroidales bacterium]
MSSSKPSIPKGTRDFSTSEMLKREYIFNSIKQVFRLYGYQPIETPSMEYLSTLLGKYGDEGDKLLFRVLNSGDFLSGITDDEILKRETVTLSSKICEKGLRYDLTVPFARYVVQHRDEITFPFRRYQIQPVWRADRPQKGRYREFFQCDADIIGSDSLLNEFELLRIIDDVFSKLNISVEIKLNNRKILTGIAEYAGIPERITDITVAIDKIEKIGFGAVIEELKEKGLSQASIDRIYPFLELKGSTSEKLYQLKTLLSGSEAGMKGIDEITVLFQYLEGRIHSSKVELDLTLARGLNYYTGAIIEVKARDTAMGSICGGGRYDNLTGVFGLPGVSGVGISFGADRIYDVMTQLNLFDQTGMTSTEALIVNFGQNETDYSVQIADNLRKAGIRTEFYPDPAKLKKQFSYADSKKIPFIIIAGEDEIKNESMTVKIMSTGEQQKISLKDIESFARTVIRKEKEPGSIH